MKKTFIALTLALTAGLFAPNVPAEDFFAPVQKTGDATPDNANWFSLGPQFGLNINARFNHLGNVSPSSPGPATGGGVDRTYDDGYVHVDSSGNAGGETWNWGYQSAPQVQGDTLTMHSGSATINGTLNQNDNPAIGFDLAFGRNLGAVPGGKWGLQAAFDFSDISIHNNDTLTGTGTQISDAFSLGGAIPPMAPYAGSFAGPGALLGDTPNRTTASDTVLIAGRRCRITGTISMDQLTVLLPDDPGAVRPGDEVVFIGRSGAERILAEDVARQLDTINYEVTCDVSPRVVRRYRESPESPETAGSA